MAGKFNLLNEIRKLLSEKQIADLLTFFVHVKSDHTYGQLALDEIINGFDWKKSRTHISKLLAQQLPVEQLVPEQYSAWRVIVREAFIYISAHLSIQRLIPKLIEQIRLPEDATLEQRLITFIEQMPTLQKLGQVIARNRELTPEFRTALIKLENDIRDIPAEKVKLLIEDELGTSLKDYQVELEDMIHSEASVCALLRFSWFKPKTKQREQGVFKVLKPYIRDNFREEVLLLKGLAAHLDTIKEHVLKDVNLHETFAGIADSLSQELDTLQEQTNLYKADVLYNNVSGIRVPEIIRELSTRNLTAMSFEEGKKVTDQTNKAISKQIIETLIAAPLFSVEEEALFHADPHAGNLYVDEKTGELIVFDWALTGNLNREERGKIIMLFMAVTLRDENLLLNSLIGLSQDKLNLTKTEKLKDIIENFIDDLSLYRLPGVNDVLNLTDQVLMLGIRFSSALMLFRKVLLTLDGVLHDIGEELAIENIVTQYVMQQMTYSMNFWSQSQTNFCVPLSHSDTLSLMWSAQWYGVRTSIKNTEKLFKQYQ